MRYSLYILFMIVFFSPAIGNTQNSLNCDKADFNIKINGKAYSNNGSKPLMGNTSHFKIVPFLRSSTLNTPLP